MNLDTQMQLVRIMNPKEFEIARKEYEEEKQMSVDLNNWQNMFNIIGRFTNIRNIGEGK